MENVFFNQMHCDAGITRIQGKLSNLVLFPLRQQYFVLNRMGSIWKWNDRLGIELNGPRWLLFWVLVDGTTVDLSGWVSSRMLEKNHGWRGNCAVENPIGRRKIERLWIEQNEWKMELKRMNDWDRALNGYEIELDSREANWTVGRENRAVTVRSEWKDWVEHEKNILIKQLGSELNGWERDLND